MEINEFNESISLKVLNKRYNEILNFLFKLFNKKVINSDEYFNMVSACSYVYSKDEKNNEKINFFDDVDLLMHKYLIDRAFNIEKKQRLSRDFLELYYEYVDKLIKNDKLKDGLYLKFNKELNF